MKKLLFIFLLCGVGFAQSHTTTLTWNWSQGTGSVATGFHIYKWTALASDVSAGKCALPSPLPTVPFATISTPTVFTFVDATPQDGQNNCYYATSFNPGGDSVPSNTALAIVPFSVPVAPSNLQAVSK